MKIVICDDMEGICKYYENVFSKIDNMELCGIAYDGDMCLDIVKKTKPDILLLDIQMRTQDEGLVIIPELLKIHPDLKIIMLTAHDVDDYVFRAFSLGAKNFLYKTAGDDEIVKRIEEVNNNQATIDSEIAEILAKKSQNVMKMQESLLYMIHQITKLSKSEMNILRGVYYGKTYREIAAERYVEEGTIRTQISGILRKLNCSSMKVLIKSLKNMDLFEFIDLYGDK